MNKTYFLKNHFNNVLYLISHKLKKQHIKKTNKIKIKNSKSVKNTKNLTKNIQ